VCGTSERFYKFLEQTCRLAPDGPEKCKKRRFTGYNIIPEKIDEKLRKLGCK